MPQVYKPAQFIYRGIRPGNWLGLSWDKDKQKVACNKGDILTLKDGVYTLSFHAFNDRRRVFEETRKNYKSLLFPTSFKINPYLQFRADNGNYKLPNEAVFRKLINPKGKKVNSVIITQDKTEKIAYDSAKFIITISEEKFRESMTVAERINKRASSYGGSVRNYLSNQESIRFTDDTKVATTSFNKGEMKFAVDRLNLPNKRTKAKLLQYLDAQDITSVESLAEKMLRHELFSDGFLRKINDFFIKERLQDIILLGREILLLKSTDLSTAKAQKIIKKVDYKYSGKGSLEALWQAYFNKYLLFLIFSYKRVFPKVELTNIDGSKKYPDFIGINHYNGLDIIEIKTHLANALKWDASHNNFYFSAELSKAIIQSKNYMDSIMRVHFKNSADKTKIIQSTEEENLYHPRAIIIISSMERLTNHQGEDEKLKRDFTKLRNGLLDIEILTFDEILDIADEYMKNITHEDSALT